MSLPMQKARYHAHAVASDFGGTSKNNNMQISVTFEIEHEEHAGERITWIATFTDSTSERIIESLMHAGWRGDDLFEFTELEDAREMLPDTVELDCEPDTYEGQTRLKVQWVNKPGGGRFAFQNKADPNDARAFAAQMRATIQGVRGAGGAQRRQQTTGQQNTGQGGGRPDRRDDRRDDRDSWGNNRNNRQPSGRNDHPNAPGGPRDRDDIPF